MKLYISDLHFFHTNLITQMDNRNFPSVQEMNKYIIDKWNDKVRGGDTIYVIGDMFYSKEPSEINPILHKLKGKICLIEGNHDCIWLKRTGIDLARFEWIKPYAEIEDGKSTLILSHYPIFCYNHQYQKKSDGSPKTFMLYGHVHNTHDEQLINQFQNITRQTKVLSKGVTEPKAIPCNMINCFCMFSDYTPLSLKEWIAVDKARREALSLD